MDGEAGDDATQGAGLPSRLFGGVRRDAAEEAIAAAERRANEFATEVEQLRARLSAQDEELARLRAQEAAVTAALTDAQASADRLRARSERLAEARLREAQHTLRDLRRHSQGVVLDLLRHVKQATETLDQLSKAADELPVDEPGTAAREPGPGVAAPAFERSEPEPAASSPTEAAPTTAPPTETAPPEPPPAEPTQPAVPPFEPAPREPTQPAAPPFEPPPREVAPSEPAPPAPGGPPAGQLEVHVEPVGSAERAIAFERRLLELDGVRNVRLLAFGGDAATFNIEIDGDGPDLLPLMEEGVQILAVSADRIELRLPSEEG